MRTRISVLASIVALGLFAAMPVHADDPLKEIIDRGVPALKDGTRLPTADVQQAILQACARRKFKAAVDEPGTITARWENRGHWFEVTIPYTDAAYSIRYKNSERMDYNPVKRRIDDAYNEYVAGLAEHIEAGLDHALARFKKARKAKKAA